MHPNPLFRSDDRAALERLIGAIGFGEIFLTTPEGPRVAHTPLLQSGPDRLQFHLSLGNALTRHLDGATALAVVNGAHGYVSPRWYDNRDTVPTWDYVTIELEGPIRRMDYSETESLLHALIDREEGRLGGERWSAEEKSPDGWDRLAGMIRGFEMDIAHWRPTFKLSQKLSAAERKNIAERHRDAGNPRLAEAMAELCA